MGRYRLWTRTLLAGGLISLFWGCSSEPPTTPEPLFRTKNPFLVPSDKLADSDAEACTLYREESCSQGRLRRCAIFDTSQDDFVTPDPLTHRAFLYERWYELYQSPDGLHAKRRFSEPIPGDMGEADWAAPERFAEYNGMGDSAIWTGTALNAHILRYLVTGSEADYQRMEKQARQALTLFDVTGIDGYLARYHWYRVPADAPQDDAHTIFTDERPLQHNDYEIEDPSAIAELPELYTSGMVDGNGQRWMGTAMWHGAPTIDQYSGMTTSLPAAWGLLRDEALKSRIVRHLTCYLKRLRRAEIINVQQNLEARELVQLLFENSEAQLDEDDIDLTKIDTAVLYFLEQPNSANTETFDRSCPDEIATEPVRVIDANADDFLSQILQLIGDAAGAKTSLRPGNIDHYYIANARGADAVHLMGLASMAYHFTGDEMYRDFLENELIGNLKTIEVAKTYSAVIPPMWCRKWYASHISIGPLWGFNNLLDRSSLLTEMQTVMYEEAWQKDAAKLDNAKFSFMFAGTVPEGMSSEIHMAARQAVDTLTRFGGNGGMLDAPRRTYNLGYEEVASQLPDLGIETTCPTDDIVRYCEEGQVAFGVSVNPFDITEPCTGAPYECTAYNGECTNPRATTALPVELREMWGFQWQGDPFRIGQPVAPEQSGIIQASGIDLIESYWLARHYGLLPDADTQVLAWQDAGTCQ